MKTFARNLNHKTLWVSCIVFLGTFFGAQVGVYAQDEYPREYTNPDEIVAFDKSTNYDEAIEIINQFAQEYRNKFIIDQTNTTGTIGTSLPAMHWEDALKYILRLKSLASVDHEEYIEVVTLSSLAQAQQQAAGVPQTAAGTGGATTAGSNINLNTREIRINATFFEGNRRALQEIGVDWSTLSSDVPANLNEIVGGDLGGPDLLTPQPIDYGNSQWVSVNSYNADVSQNVFNALVNFGQIGPVNVQALFSALEADNLGEVLATPSIKVMDGVQGRIQVGQDFSVKQRDIAGNVTDNFFSTGTILIVTPTVISVKDTNFIHLNIEVERSSAQPDAVSTIINKQDAQTQALLLDGEATSIAGLYRTEQTEIRRGIPILKDLPPWFFGLRYLFGYNSNDYIENELVILVQAELEESLSSRIAKTFATKNELLTQTRDDFRNDMDRRIENPFAVLELEEDSTMQEETPVLETPIVEPDTTQPKVIHVPMDTLVVEDTPDEAPLTKEEEELAKELSLPVDNPELMVVVPRAFSLDDYLNAQANGEDVEDPTSDNLKYFIIGGSFLVKNNAERFTQSLANQGYETRVLFHPDSRFNFVAYKGFANFQLAVEYLREIKGEVNSEAWLFTKPD